MAIDRNSILSQIQTEMADVHSKIQSEITTNGNHEVTAARVRTVFEDFKLSMDTLLSEFVASMYVIESDNTDDLNEGSQNLFYTEARFNSSFNNKSTDDLNEGQQNLYHTEQRVVDIIDIQRPKQPSLSAPTGGTVIDVQARQAISQIISKLTAAGVLL